ncbi:dexamethasone-induced protein isoform X1 [Loxodonta africana]|uniref:dexamethasone-induced protein isoform X1 n=1 Tax=Loxodonta africana TaxID=9785 RepID=UPI000C811D1D|nr:dexamethasone-induced protein isoform X1 [Loxodonta africana]XP_049758847.1 dexamethasone-induced protein isoform X2 [Elephas maximus indicus]
MPPPPLGGTVWLGMGSPKARSFRASEACLLPSKASCQQKSSCADSGEREGDPGTEGRGYEGKGTDRRRRAGPSKDLASLQHHPHSLALVSNLSPLRWRLQEPDQSLPPCSPPPSCTCFPHLTFERTLQNADTRTKRLTASFDAL